MLAALHRLSALARLSNWPFAFKMAFCPALAMVAIIAISLHGLLAADRQAALMRAVVHDNLTIAMQLSGSATRLQEINSRLYRLTTLQASKAADLNVSDRIEMLVQQTSGLADDLQVQAGGIDVQEDRADVLQVASDIRLYRDAIDVFGSMLEIDFQSAVEFFRPFDRNARKVLELINTIAARAITDAGQRAELSTHIADRIRFALIAASIAGSLILFGAAALLTRATVMSVRRIATATEKVAQGSATVDIAALARGDELGTIVRSLAIFQSNVSQIAFLAHHDPLTRLPNRVLFHDRIEQALAQLDRNIGFAVLCLDLDRFQGGQRHVGSSCRRRAAAAGGRSPAYLRAGR